MNALVKVSLAAVLAGTLAACADGPAPPAPEAQAPAAPGLPTVDTAGAQGLLSPDEALQPLGFAATGSTSTAGSVVGYNSTAFAVPVAAGQTLTVEFVPSNTNLYRNIHDTRDQSGAAVFRGEFDGSRAVLTPSEPTTYLIRPFQPRAMARRGERGEFTLTVSRG
jgi:hypothetical protein